MKKFTPQSYGARPGVQVVLGAPANEPEFDPGLSVIKVRSSDVDTCKPLTSYCMVRIEEHRAKFFSEPAKLMLDPAAARRMMNECPPALKWTPVTYGPDGHMGQFCGINVYVEGDIR